MPSPDPPARRSSKAPKKHPGVRLSAYTGRTTGGYSPATAARRAAKRAIPAPERTT